MNTNYLLKSMAIAMHQIERGCTPSIAIEAAMFNNGVNLIGQLNEIVAYAPQMHEDTEGGMLPGDPVRIIRSGWQYDAVVYLRAKVARQ